MFRSSQAIAPRAGKNRIRNLQGSRPPVWVIRADQQPAPPLILYSRKRPVKERLTNADAMVSAAEVECRLEQNQSGPRLCENPYYLRSAYGSRPVMLCFSH